jgi:acyl carrier protein
VTEESAALTANAPDDGGWEPHFERLVRDSAFLLPDEQPLTPDTSLSEFGLDSFRTVELMVAVEAEYDIVIPEEGLVFDTFATPGALWATVLRLRRNASGRPDG